RGGGALSGVQTVYQVYAGTMSSPDFQAVEREMAPRLAAFSDQITQNAKLFARIAAVYDAREQGSLTAEQKRLVWLIHNNFVRAGAQLDADKKARLSGINQRLAGLYTSFSQNVLADETDYVLVLEKERDLAGLPGALRASAGGADGPRRAQAQQAAPHARA